MMKDVITSINILRISLLIYASIPFVANAQTICLTRSKPTSGFHYPASEIASLIAPKQRIGILYGETHTIHFEPLFKAQFIRHLNSEFGVRDIFMEIGYSLAFLFNRYLETGDTTLFTGQKLTYLKGEYKQMWNELYNYNQKLPDTLKLRIHGVDFENPDVFKTLLLLQPSDKKPSAELEKVLQKIKHFSTDKGATTRSGFKSAIRELKSDMKPKYPELQEFYGENFILVKKIIENDLFSVSTTARDKSMSKNLEANIRDLGIQHFVGFFGAMHTDAQRSTSISNYLNGKAEFKDRIITINSLLFDAYSLYTRTVLPFVGLVKKEEAAALFKKHLGNDCRAVLISTALAQESILSKSSEFYVLANDQ